MKENRLTPSENPCGPVGATALRSALAFTLIEMMVVAGMLAILMGVAFSGLGQARKQGKIAKASAEVRELVNAILSYEAAEEQLDINDQPKEATKQELEKLLGDGTSKKPAYLNVQLVRDAFRDPWGNPYRFRVLQGTDIKAGESKTTVSAAVTFPNRHGELRWR